MTLGRKRETGFWWCTFVSRFREGSVMMFYWSSWCTPCYNPILVDVSVANCAFVKNRFKRRRWLRKVLEALLMSDDGKAPGLHGKIKWSFLLDWCPECLFDGREVERAGQKLKKHKRMEIICLFDLFKWREICFCCTFRRVCFMIDVEEILCCYFRSTWQLVCCFVAHNKHVGPKYR